MYLLDTNVISELRKPKPHPAVVEWIEAASDEALFISAVTVGELQAGIEITRRRDTAKAAEISRWLDLVEQSYAILPADAAVFRQWAGLMHGRPDHHLEDALIAATALVRRLIVATRHVDDFRLFDVPVVNPFRS